MILALDIGNSRIKAGMRGRGTVRYAAAATRPFRDAPGYAELLGITDTVEGVIIASVVDELNDSFKNYVFHSTGREPIMVTSALDSGLHYSVINPARIGPDRIANAVGGYAACNGPAIVVDLGSATTLTVVGEDREFLGGAILPGAEMMAGVLGERTSKLPQTAFALPTSAIGKDTEENIRSGICYGTAGAVERLIDEIAREIDYTISVVLTGGMSEVFRDRIRTVDIVDPLITMKGLFLMYDRVGR